MLPPNEAAAKTVMVEKRKSITFAVDEPRPRTRVDDESSLEAVYRLGDVLGKGTFGVVREVTHKTTGQHFAMKIVNKDKVGIRCCLHY